MSSITTTSQNDWCGWMNGAVRQNLNPSSGSAVNSKMVRQYMERQDGWRRGGVFGMYVAYLYLEE